jgi:hypothetical protein
LSGKFAPAARVHLVLVAGEVDDPVDLVGGVQVPDEGLGRVDLAVSAHEGAAVAVDDVLVARLLIAVLLRGGWSRPNSSLARPRTSSRYSSRSSWVSSS